MKYRLDIDYEIYILLKEIAEHRQESIEDALHFCTVEMYDDMVCEFRENIIVERAD